MDRFSLEFNCLPLKVVDCQGSILQRDENSSALVRVIIKENHRVCTFAADLVRLAWFIAGHIPALNCARFIIGGDEVARTVRHPHYVVNYVLLGLEALDDFCVRCEALEADQAHSLVSKAD